VVNILNTRDTSSCHIRVLLYSQWLKWSDTGFQVPIKLLMAILFLHNSFANSCQNTDGQKSTQLLFQILMCPVLGSHKTVGKEWGPWFHNIAPKHNLHTCHSKIITRDSTCYSVYMPGQFRLSVTRVICIKTAERIIEILSPSDRPIILVFRHQGSLIKSDGFTPNGGAKYNGVAIFDQYTAISRKR